MRRTSVPLRDAWRLLNPCPTVLITSSGRVKGTPAGRIHLCAAAWCMPLDFSPPKAVIVLASGQATTAAVLAAGELVINIPGSDLAAEVIAAGQTSGFKVDKFAALGFTQLKSRKIKTPGISECLAHLECRVLEQKSSLGKSMRKSYDLIPLEILHARVNPGCFKKRWLFEKGFRLLHHLGSEGFVATGDLIFMETTR